MPVTASSGKRSSGALLGRPAALALAIIAAGCSVWVDRGREQCSSDQDCQSRGEAFAGSTCQMSVCQPDPTWSCLGSVDWSPPAQSRLATVIIRVRDLVTEQPMLGVTARLCRKLDLTCSQPIGEDLVADQDGNLVMRVEAGFDGYAELRAKDKMPGLYFFYPPVDKDRDVPFVPLLSPPLLAQFAQLNSQQPTSDRGHVLLVAYDCPGHPAEGVHLSTPDGDGTAFYVVDKFPKISATATDRSGRAGFINLKAGTVTVVGELADERRVSSLGLLIRPGAITYTALVPSPR
jgi:hypothetical protein